MTIEAIAPLGANTLSDSAAAPKAGAPDFAHWISGQLGELNEQIATSQTQLAQLAGGANGNLHQVMLDMEKAKLAFQLTVHIRNKVLEGYQDIMRMQL